MLQRFNRENRETTYILILVAISFMTRIPVRFPQHADFEYQPEHLEQASQYFALVGCLIGLLNAAVFLLCAAVLPVSVAIILSMVFGLLLTGAFHEDGLADVFDGFGGGWQIKDKLDIMKDSRLGTYGAAALMLALLLKFQALAAMPNIYQIALVMVLAHTLSRTVATSLIFSMDYVVQDASSKVKPVAKHITPESLHTLLVTAGIVLFIYWSAGVMSLLTVFMLIGLLMVVRFGLKQWFTQQLSGYTGDCLGAAQQICEISIYLMFLAVFI